MKPNNHIREGKLLQVEDTKRAGVPPSYYICVQVAEAVRRVSAAAGGRQLVTGHGSSVRQQVPANLPHVRARLPGHILLFVCRLGLRR